MSTSKLYFTRIINFFDKMLAVIPVGDQELHALAYYGQARVAAQKGDTHKALVLGRQSATIFESIGHGSEHTVRTWLEQFVEAE